MSLSDADKHDKLKKWLALQPVEVSLLIVNRCALRCLPYITSRSSPLVEPEQLVEVITYAINCANISMVLSENATSVRTELIDDARSKLRYSALSIEASAWGKKHAEKIMEGSEDEKYYYGEDAIEVESALHAKDAASVAGDATDVATMIFSKETELSEQSKNLIHTLSADGVLYASQLLGEDVWVDIYEDITYFRDGSSQKQIYEMPLRTKKMPVAERERFDAFLREHSMNHWQDWYANAERGRAIDWALTREIATLAPLKDEEGVKSFNLRIGEMHAAWALERAISQFRDKLSLDGRHGIGGNYPPSQILDGDIPETNNLLFIEEIKTLEEASNSASRNFPLLRSIITRIERGFARFLLWCGQKADRAVDKLVDWGVPVGVAAALTDTTMVSEAVGQILSAARNLLNFAP